jgi:hypothetical protein
MKTLTLLGLVLLSSCAVPSEEEETESVEQAVYHNDKCDPLLCGMNAAELTNGFFHELNLDGLENDEGYSLVGVSKNGVSYRLSVLQGKISATSLGIAGSTTLSGANLIGLKLRLKKWSSTYNTYYYYIISIRDVASAQYWAKRTNGLPTPPIETYELVFSSESTPWLSTYMCRDGAEFVFGGDPRAMRKHHALVFEGDRINVQSLEVESLDARWFNFGCAETALAKMQLNGHTHASMTAGLWVPRLERQTFLKMIAADYCGTGRPFTVSGQRLRWTDDHGTMTIASTVPKTMEARWDSEGPTCLNTPRIDAHPTDASRVAFPRGAEAAIASVCQRPPPCAQFAPVHHITSWNPTTVIMAN